MIQPLAPNPSRSLNLINSLITNPNPNSNPHTFVIRPVVFIQHPVPVVLVVSPFTVVVTADRLETTAPVLSLCLLFLGLGFGLGFGFGLRFGFGFGFGFGLIICALEGPGPGI